MTDFSDAFEGDKGFQDSDNGLKILTGALASYDAHANGLAIAVQEFFEVKFKADPSNPELQQRLARLQVSKEKNCELNIDQAEACLGAIWPKDLVKQWRKNFDAVIERMQQEDSKADVVEEADSIQW